MGECALPALMNWDTVLHQKLYSGTGDVAAYDGKTSSDEAVVSLSGRQMLLQQPFNAYTSSKKMLLPSPSGQKQGVLGHGNGADLPSVKTGNADSVGSS